MREISSALAVPQQCEGMRGKGEKKKSLPLPTRCWWEVREMLFASLLFILEGKNLTCPIKAICHSSQEYLSLLGTGHTLFFSLMQFLVSPDLLVRCPIFITAAMLHSANEKINVPDPSATEASVPGSGSRPQSYSESPKKWLKSVPDPLDGIAYGCYQPLQTWARD